MCQALGLPQRTQRQESPYSQKVHVRLSMEDRQGTGFSAMTQGATETDDEPLA